LLTRRAGTAAVPDGGTAAAARLPLVGIAAVLVVAAAVRLVLLAGGQIDYDEGVYWESLRALAAGHPLFTSAYSSQPPAFLLLLVPGHLALGGSIAADRLTVLALAVVGVAAAGRAAWLLGGPWAGVLAAALLAADPLYLRQSVTLQADGPAVALALAGLALAAEARGRRDRPALVLAGACGAVLAVAVLCKLLAVAAVPAAAVVLVAPPAGRRRSIGLLGAAVAGGVLASALALLPFAGAWPELWRQVVGLHLGARSLAAGGLDHDTVARGLPLAVVGAAGALVGVWRAPLLAAAGSAWAAAAALLLAVQHPLWPHHAVVLVPAFALLGGALAEALAVRPLRPAVAVAAAVVALAAAPVSAGVVRGQQAPPGPAPSALRAGTAPGDLVVTDDQYAAALADRDVPPELVDTSFVRVTSGDLTAAEVEAIAERSNARGVLFASGRLALLPGFREWTAARYPRVVDLGEGRTLYLR
jgi:4-amino-4-deoxy-L-arabinose transferase-like glycosyltransferase